MLLNKLLADNLVHIESGFNSWKEAIQANAKMLLSNGYIEQEYVEAVIACVEKYGPYIVIAPNIAMPHSTENAPGVNKTGIGFMKVNQPVCFDENDPEKDARLFFMLASKDHEEHLQNMMALSEMLMDEELVEQLLQAKDMIDLKLIGDKYA